MTSEPPELVVRDAQAWREWLAGHLDQTQGVWLVLARKGTSEPTSLRYDDALEEALCQGWIDGQGRHRDEGTHLRRFTPRRARSPWSQRNVGIVARLTDQGRMQPAGLAEVERARSDGRWDAAYGAAATVGMPADLAAALAAEPRAQAMFDLLTAQNRYAVIYRVITPRTPAVRERNVTAMVAMLARGETPYPQRRRRDG